MNSMDNQNPTAQDHKELKQEVLKSIESISQQVSILWLKAQIQNPNEPLTVENIRNFLEQLVRMVKVEANKYSEKPTDDDSYDSGEDWMYMADKSTEITDILIDIKRIVDNAIYELVFINGFFGIQDYQDLDKYEKSVIKCHDDLLFNLESPLSELRDLDFTA
ncbi:MAG: hypothetical protein KFF72_03465 [Arthrospira sp. SH-MAG29]|nr:hypothetical protein [Arthrospira sp. SH-MAG29]MBS0015419.1 hypothetical protein [Arthrospira sp. SH-MAG29]